MRATDGRCRSLRSRQITIAALRFVCPSAVLAPTQPAKPLHAPKFHPVQAIAKEGMESGTQAAQGRSVLSNRPSGRRRGVSR